METVQMGWLFRRLAVMCCLAGAGMLFASFFDEGAEAQTRTERFFDDWTVLCVEGNEGAKRCSMNQTLVRNNPRREVFRWIVAANQDSELTNILSVPLGAALRPGLQIATENGDAQTIPYEVCGRQWCQARLPLSEDLAGAMAAGTQVDVVFSNARGQRMRLEVTVRGYGEALNYLQGQLAASQ